MWEMSAKWLRAMKSAKVVGINLLVLVVLLAIAEILFGNWTGGQSFGALSIPRNQVRNYSVSSLYPGGGDVVYRRDNWGFRGDVKDPAIIDMLVMGGSTTAERMVSEEQTWVARMQDRLAARGTSIAVANAGIDGQSTVGHLRAMQHWLKRIPGLEPMYVILFVGINDMHLEPWNEVYDQVADSDPIGRIIQRAKNDSAMVWLWHSVAAALRARRAHIVHGANDPSQFPWKKTPLSDLSEARADPARLKAYGERLRKLINEIGSWGAMPIIATQHRGTYRLRKDWLEVPADGPFSGTADYFVQKDFNRVSLEVCRESGALCIDLDGLEFEPGDFYDYVHTTPAGSAKIGRFIADRLSESLATM
jgi:lysophospholipase L1-like esterase